MEEKMYERDQVVKYMELYGRLKTVRTFLDLKSSVPVPTTEETGLEDARFLLEAFNREVPDEIRYELGYERSLEQSVA